jgi:diacylglycerol kinase family enzyme
MKRNLLFIVNPISGIGKQKKIEELLDKSIDKSLIDYTVRYTERIHHGKDLAREAVDEGCFDAIVAVGGDGSVNDVVSGMADSGMTLGIIPC